MPWIVYVGAGFGFYILAGTLSSKPGEIQTISAFAIMMFVFAIPPIVPLYFIQITSQLFAVVDLRLIAPLLILLIAWSNQDGEWTWGLGISLVPIVASWYITSLV
jgi:hypothetical protein